MPNPATMPRRWITVTLEEQPGSDWAADMSVNGKHVESFPPKPPSQALPPIAKALVECMVGARSPEEAS